MLIHQACIGCGHLKGSPCDMYDYPELQHRRIGGCAGRTHSKTIMKEDDKKINPLKASKRSQERKK